MPRISSIFIERVVADNVSIYENRKTRKHKDTHYYVPSHQGKDKKMTVSRFVIDLVSMP